jgi:CMP-N-acetylneuraminic acid synthetase
MKKEDVVFFLPTRKGSQRVINKNTKPFAGIPGGLVENKLHQLLKVKSIDTIVISTDDERTIEIVEGINPKGKKIEIIKRPAELSHGKTLVEDFINYIPTIVKAEVIFWVHATAPFVDENDYELAIEQYFKEQESYDSVLSVTKLQQFIWSKESNTIINCDRSVNKWPNTQDLTPLFEINHAFYISSRQNYIKYSDRIGVKPYLFELSKIKSFDIDWNDDFVIAESIFDKFFKPE